MEGQSVKKTVQWTVFSFVSEGYARGESRQSLRQVLSGAPKYNLNFNKKLGLLFFGLK